jgi:hypothetical protein
MGTWSSPPAVEGRTDPEGTAMIRLPRTLGLLIVPILLASCANATSLTPGEGDTGGGSSGISVPGSTGSGTIDRENPTDRVMKPCGTSIVSGSGPDATVGYAPCPSYGAPVTPAASPVEPTPGMADVHAIGWDTADVSTDGLHLTISFVSGVEPCSVLDHVDVAYGDNAVTVTLFEGHEPSAGQVACPAIAMFKQTIVDLTEAVGGREVKDGTD